MALVTYRGYLENGKFIAMEEDISKIPNKINVMVTLLEDYNDNEDIAATNQYKALEELFSKINNVTGEELNEDFHNETQQARLNITRDINL
jgi:hypothetical protein